MRQFTKDNTSSLIEGVIVKVMNSNLHVSIIYVFVLRSTPNLICATLHLENN